MNVEHILEKLLTIIHKHQEECPLCGGKFVHIPIHDIKSSTDLPCALTGRWFANESRQHLQP